MLRFYVKLGIFFLLVLFWQPVIFAEESVQFFEKMEIVQIINWDAEKDVLKYEFVIQKKDETGSGYTTVSDFSTEKTTVELSLTPGEYRYRVIVYDLLGRMRPAPEWSRLTVFPALQPEIVSVNPPHIDISNFSGDVEIELTGENLVEKAEVYFTPAEAGLRAILLDEALYTPNSDGKSAVLKLKYPLETGFYDIVIKNPGGLSTAWRNYKITDGSEIPVQSKPSIKIVVAGGYTVLIPLVGALNNIIKEPIYPLGFTARLGANKNIEPYGIFGLETALFWHFLGGINDLSVKSGNLMDVHIGLLYQIKLFNEKAALNFRIGGGLSYIAGIQFSESITSQFSANDTVLSTIAGSLSFSWFFYRTLFIDLGFEYKQLFSINDDPQPAYIRPSICFGSRL
ncbi:MAG: hypothetical protein LBB22_02100 [Treponema sp.]|nr:hypothetical protein [Treponema sp.]